MHYYLHSAGLMAFRRRDRTVNKVIINHAGAEVEHSGIPSVYSQIKRKNKLDGNRLEFKEMQAK
jgi:hypothetical protein